jgi:nickel transport protein
MKALLIVALLMLSASPAWAHKLKLFVSAEGGEMVGSAYFAGGGKAVGLSGQVIDAAGTVIASVHTDENGRFRYTPPDGRAYLIRFESGDGHMAEARIGAASVAETTAPVLTPASDNAALEVALARQLRPLREQIDALESRARLSDIIGGIGFIFGIFGCFTWVNARRQVRS